MFMKKFMVLVSVISAGLVPSLHSMEMKSEVQIANLNFGPYQVKLIPQARKFAATIAGTTQFKQIFSFLIDECLMSEKHYQADEETPEYKVNDLKMAALDFFRVKYFPTDLMNPLRENLYQQPSIKYGNSVENPWVRTIEDEFPALVQEVAFKTFKTYLSDPENIELCRLRQDVSEIAPNKLKIYSIPDPVLVDRWDKFSSQQYSAADEFIKTLVKLDCYDYCRTRFPEVLPITRLVEQVFVDVFLSEAIAANKCKLSVDRGEIIVDISLSDFRDVVCEFFIGVQLPRKASEKFICDLYGKFCQLAKKQVQEDVRLSGDPIIRTAAMAQYGIEEQRTLPEICDRLSDFFAGNDVTSGQLDEFIMKLL